MNAASLVFDDNFEHDTVKHESISSLSSSPYPSNKTSSIKIDDLLLPVSTTITKSSKTFQRTPRRPQPKRTTKDEDTTAESSTCPSDINIGKTSKRRKKAKIEVSFVHMKFFI